MIKQLAMRMEKTTGAMPLKLFFNDFILETNIRKKEICKLIL